MDRANNELGSRLDEMESQLKQEHTEVLVWILDRLQHLCVTRYFCHHSLGVDSFALVLIHGSHVNHSFSLVNFLVLCVGSCLFVVAGPERYNQ